jgi:integrase
MQLDAIKTRCYTRSNMNATSTTKPKAGVYDVHKFVHRGRKRQIFRRFPQGNFTIRREVDGEPMWKTLDTPIAKIAIANAKGWLDEVQQCAMDKKWSRLDPLRSRTPWASIGDILERYEARATGAVQIAKDSVKSNANCLRQLLRIATGTEDPDALRADILTESTARTFIEKCRKSERSESGIRSSLVQARCVFSPALLYIYDGLKLPDLSGFRVRVKFNTSADTGFQEISADVVQRMETAASALQLSDPATWLVFMLMSRLGLRNSDIERATIDYLQEDDAGAWHLAVPAAKGGKPRFLRLPDDLPAETILQIAGDGPHLIPAPTATERKNICQRYINRFMRQFIPDRRTCAYELRKLAGSLVWSTQDPRAAQKFLGHSSISTTEKFYAKDLRAVRAISAADRASIYGPEKAA